VLNYASVLLQMLPSSHTQLDLLLLLNQWHQSSLEASQAYKYTFFGRDSDSVFTGSQERPDSRHCEGKETDEN